MARGAACRGAPHPAYVSIGHELTRRLHGVASAITSIVLQKSNVAGLRIFRENTKREAIADSFNLNRVTEIACEFNARR
jgi:hypothetical protein